MSAAVITYHRVLGRWEPDARGWLAKAVMALYVEQEFEQATGSAELGQQRGVVR